MLRELFISREDQIEATYSRLIQDLATTLPVLDGLGSVLQAVAETVARLEGLRTALVVVCDVEGFPVRWRGSEVPAGGEALLGDRLAAIYADLRGSGWQSIPGNWINGASNESTSGCKIQDDSGLIWMLLVSQSETRAAAEVLEGIGKACSYLTWLIRSAFQSESLRCTHQLQHLELDELGRSRQIEPQNIVEKLKDVFAADAATILVREQGKLYLSATTDTDLGEDLVEYKPGVGISGFIFSTGSPVRIYDATDQDELHRRLGESRKKAYEIQYPEALAKSGEPFRLLAVPMRSGWKDDPQGLAAQDSRRAVRGVRRRVRGVIRVLRRKDSPAFTNFEQKALQHFADLLAVAMYASWRLHLADSVIGAETEAICISRTEPGKGQSRPTLVYAERGAEVVFGRKKEELVGMDGRKLYQDGEYGKIRTLLDQAISEGRTSCGPEKANGIRFKKSGNETRSLDISYRLVTSPFVRPAARYTIAVIRDITEAQLEADQHKRLVALLEQRGMAYFQANEDGLTTKTSGTESKITGYTATELVGKSRASLYADPKQNARLLKEVYRKDGDLVRSTLHMRRKDGSTVLTESVMHLLKDDQSKPAGYEGLYEDISDRVRLQGFLDADPGKVLKEHELYRKLEENARFQLLFMTSLSHQLRSPLGALVQQLLNFKDGVVDSDRFSRRLTYAIGQAQVSSLLVANLTYMDKILRGESFSFQPVSMASLAIATKHNFNHLLPEKRLKLVVDGESLNRHLVVAGHPELLRQVFVNLIDNAIKYSRRGCRIRICGRHDQLGRYVQVSNLGIPLPEERDQVFQRGFRTAKAEALIPAGTGLGLWLVRKIATVHHATIRCTTIHEEGEDRTAFQVFFPDGDGRRGRNGTRGR